MPHEKSFWYKVGYALERTRDAPTKGKRALEGLKDRVKPEAASSRKLPKPPNPESWPTAEGLLVSATATAAGKLLDAWKPRSKTGVIRLVRAGLSGAAAAFLVELVRPLLEGRMEPPVLDRRLADRLMAGAGQGLVYGAVVEPRVPGPAAFKGALYGSAEYAVDPAGGLAHLLGGHAPQSKLPVVGQFLEDLDEHDRAYLEHVVFGMAVALLYGSSSGILVEVTDEE